MDGQDIRVRKRGRPVGQTVGPPITVRLPLDDLAALDQWGSEEMPGASRRDLIKAALRDWLVGQGRLKP